MSETLPPLWSVEVLADGEPEIGRWLWAIEDVRSRTLEALAGIDQPLLDWTPPPGGNSIGTLLYHIAAIELDWLAVEVLEEQPQPWTKEVAELFAVDVRNKEGQLTPIAGRPVADHLVRFNVVRQRLLEAFRAMPLEEFRRPRHLPDYRVTPEWVLYHLIQHEAEHQGQVQLLRTWAEQARENV